jgi:hypothetical protein
MVILRVEARLEGPQQDPVTLSIDDDLTIKTSLHEVITRMIERNRKHAARAQKEFVINVLCAPVKRQL